MTRRLNDRMPSERRAIVRRLSNGRYLYGRLSEKRLTDKIFQ